MKLGDMEELLAKRQDTGHGGAPGRLYAIRMIVMDIEGSEEAREWFEFVTFGSIEELERWLWRAHHHALKNGYAEVYTTTQYFVAEDAKLWSRDMMLVKRIG